jgi:hypothetical protein
MQIEIRVLGHNAGVNRMNEYQFRDSFTFVKRQLASE